MSKNIAFLGTSHAIKFKKFFENNNIDISFHSIKSTANWLDLYNHNKLEINDGLLNIDNKQLNLNDLDCLIIIDMGFQYQMLQTYLFNQGFIPTSLITRLNLKLSQITPITDFYIYEFAKNCSGLSNKFDDNKLNSLKYLIDDFSNYTKVIIVPASFWGKLNDSYNKLTLHFNKYSYQIYSKVLKDLFPKNIIIKPNLEYLNEDLTMPNQYLAEDIENLHGKISHQNPSFAKIIWDEIIEFI